jgi:hypothetical protein
MRGSKSLRDGAGAVVVPSGAGLKLGEIAALPTAGIAYQGEIRQKTGVFYACNKTGASTWAWQAFQPLDSDLTTIAALADPNADRILFWDDSAGAYAYLTASTGLDITGTTLTAKQRVLLSSSTPSAASSVSFDNVFTATYETYEILISNMSQSAAQDWRLWLRLKVR